MKEFKYNLHVTGFCEFVGNRVDLNFHIDNMGINGEHSASGNHNDLADLVKGIVKGAVKYEVELKGEVVIYGLHIDVDKEFKS